MTGIQELLLSEQIGRDMVAHLVCDPEWHFDPSVATSRQQNAYLAYRRTEVELDNILDIVGGAIVMHSSSDRAAEYHRRRNRRLEQSPFYQLALRRRDEARQTFRDTLVDCPIIAQKINQAKKYSTSA